MPNEEPKLYPYIGKCHKTGTVVAFVAPNTGVCIASDNPYDDPIGDVSDNWTESVFDPYPPQH